ncbi:hypothetical protein N2152v2_008266 [Parachlorella kessleri]
MATRHALQDAIDYIDAFIAKLENGALISSGPTQQPGEKTPAAAPQPPEPAPQPAKQPPPSSEGKKKAKPAKAAKAAPAAEPAAASAASPEEELLGKAQLVVARVVSVQPHPNSNKLYICKVDAGEGKERQVVAGLQRHVPAGELEGSLVVTVLNLKAAKLAGELSEAMILAASVHQGDTELVRVLRPAEGAEPGQPVFVEGATPPSEFPKVCKQWSKVVEGLAVKANRASFSGRVLASTAGQVAVAEDMPEGAGIH